MPRRGRPVVRAAAELLVGVVIGATVLFGAGGSPALASSRGVASTSVAPHGTLTRLDDASVCRTSAKQVTASLKSFVAQMRKVSDLARSGDLIGAQTQVKQAGATLVALSDHLRADVASADTAQLKATVGALAKEFGALGRSLTDLSALQSFNTTRLDSLAGTMKKLCGPSAVPSAVTT